MVSSNVNNMAGYLKIRYPNGVAFQGVKKSKFWGLCPKDTKFTGSSKEVKVAYSPGTGGSSDFSKALQNRGPTQIATFTITRKRDYVIGSLENEAILASQGNEGAVKALLDEELDKKGIEFGMRLARRVVGYAGGSLGRLAASGAISTNTFILLNRSDVRNFYPGQVLQFASDDGTGTSPSANREGTVTVSKVSLSSTAATITTTANVTTGIPAAANSDYVFSDGDYGQAPTGVLGWIPLTAPSSGESFLGVDRSTHVTALSGVRYTGGGRDMVEVLNNASAEGFPFGAEGEYIFCAGTDFARLQNTLEGKACTREVKSVDGAMSYKGAVLYTTYGELTVFPEPYWPEGYALITTMSDWVIRSLGELPHFSDTGHGKLQQEAAADARQFRLVGYWNTECKNPGNSTLLSW